MAKFEVPTIMKFTVLPYEITARAWLNPTFLDDLIKYPREFLLAKSGLFPRDAEYVILPDTISVKHFILPNLPDGIDNEQLLSILESETAGEQDYSEFLPAAVLHKAFTNPEFKKRLFTGPITAVAELGSPCPTPMKIIENSPMTYHIPLRVHPHSSANFLDLYIQLRKDAVVLNTSKDCASGTCNGGSG